MFRSLIFNKVASNFIKKRLRPTQVFLFFYITPPDNRVCHFLYNSGKCQNKGNVVTPWVKFVAFWEVTL